MTKRFFCAFLFLFASTLVTFADDYMPLKAGATSEYSVNLTGKFSHEPTRGTFIQKVLPSQNLNNQKLIPVQNGGGYLDFYAETKDGIIHWGHQSASDIQPIQDEALKIILPSSHKLGTSWKYNYNTSLLTKNFLLEVDMTVVAVNETLTLPAGVFEHCILIKYKGKKAIPSSSTFALQGKSVVTVEGYDWYAPGVGFIHSIVNETGVGYSSHKEQGQIVMLLTKFSK
jgi:hypothetical protein